MVYRYSGDVDILKIFFIRATPGIIEESQNVTDSVVADFDNIGRLVALEIMNASNTLSCHFFDYPGEVDGKL